MWLQYFRLTGSSGWYSFSWYIVQICMKKKIMIIQFHKFKWAIITRYAKKWYDIYMRHAFMSIVQRISSGLALCDIFGRDVIILCCFIFHSIALMLYSLLLEHWREMLHTCFSLEKANEIEKNVCSLILFRFGSITRIKMSENVEFKYNKFVPSSKKHTSKICVNFRIQLNITCFSLEIFFSLSNLNHST